MGVPTDNPHSAESLIQVRRKARVETLANKPLVPQNLPLLLIRVIEY